MKNEAAGNMKMAVMMAVVAVVIASVALLAVSKMQRSSMDGGTSGKPATGEGTAPVSPSAPSKPLDLSYTQALDLYSDSYRFQFSSCSGTPGTLSVASGVTVMLDNRDSVAHTIKVGSSSYSLGAYGFRVIKASTKGKLQITCDGKGAAVLNVQ